MQLDRLSKRCGAFAKTREALVWVLALGLFLRLLFLDSQSVWVDEGHSLAAMNLGRSLGDLYTELVVTNTHLPFYFLSLRALAWLFGPSLELARLYSALIGVAGVWAVYLLGRTLRGPAFGLMTALICATHFFMIYHSQEIRYYGLVYLLGALSWHYLLRYLQGHHRRDAWGWLVVTVLFCSTFYYAAFNWAAQATVVLIWWLRPSSRPSRVVILRTIGVAVLPLLPLIVMVLSSSFTRRFVLDGQSTINVAPKADWLFDYWGSLFGLWMKGISTLPAPWSGDGIVYYAAAGVLVAGVLWWIREQRSSHTRPRSEQTDRDTVETGRLGLLAMSGLLVVGVALPFAQCVWSNNPLYPRYLNYVLPAVHVFLAAGLWSIAQPKNRLLGSGLFLVVLTYNSFTTTGSYMLPYKDDYLGLHRFLATRLDSYPVLADADQPLNELDYLVSRPSEVIPISSDLARAELAQTQGFWRVELSYFPRPTPQDIIDTIRSQFAPVRIIDRYRSLKATLYLRHGHSSELPTGLTEKAQLGRPIRTILTEQPDNFRGKIDDLVQRSPSLWYLSGWATLNDYTPQKRLILEVILVNDSAAYSYPVQPSERTDLEPRRRMAGVNVVLNTAGLAPGTYAVGLRVLDTQTGRVAYASSGLKRSIVVP